MRLLLALLLLIVRTCCEQHQQATSPLVLQDGVPLVFTGNDSSPKQFSYQPQNESKLLIMSDSVLDIDLGCLTHNSPLEKAIKHSHILNISTVELKKQQCGSYIIKLSGMQEGLRYTLLVNEKDVILLDYQQTMPGTANKERKQIYEIAVRDQTFLKIIVRLCQWVPARVVVATTLQKFEDKQYDYLYDIPEDEPIYVIGHTAKPGVVYFSVMADELLEYSASVFSFASAQEQMNATSAVLDDSFIEVHYLEKNNSVDFHYNLTFQPLKMHSNSSQQYKVKYVLFESDNRTNLKMMTRCNGFTTPGIRHQHLQTVQDTATGKLTAQYISTMSSSYATIVARVDPQLPHYVAYEQYHIVQFSTALGPLPIERFIEKLLTLIENITSIEDSQTLNFILFVLVFAINMVCVTLCCCLLACHARRIKNSRGSRLPTTEVQASRSKQESTVIFEVEQKL